MKKSSYILASMILLVLIPMPSGSFGQDYYTYFEIKVTTGGGGDREAVVGAIVPPSSGGVPKYSEWKEFTLPYSNTVMIRIFFERDDHFSSTLCDQPGVEICLENAWFVGNEKGYLVLITDNQDGGSSNLDDFTVNYIRLIDGSSVYKITDRSDYTTESIDIGDSSVNDDSLVILGFSTQSSEWLQLQLEMRESGTKISEVGCSTSQWNTPLYDLDDFYSGGVYSDNDYWDVWYSAGYAMLDPWPTVNLC